MLSPEAWQDLAEALLARRAGAVVVLASATGRPLAQAGDGTTPLPPGSALKPLWALAWLEAGPDRGGSSWRCEGALVDAQGQRHLCWLPGGHGRVDLPQALGRSCNLVALRWGQSLGPRLQRQALARCGWPGGQPGGGRGPLGPSLTLGEGPASWVSAQDLAKWALDWARGGPAWASRASATLVRSGLLAGTAPSGTAHAAAGLPGGVAAKTGTVPWGPTPQTLGWCWGFAPFDRPQVAFAVRVPGQGGRDAAPLVGRLLREGLGR